MTKLTYEQAVKLVEQASQESTEMKFYRFGQALWNLIPTEVSNPWHMTEYDFFYWVDNARVVEVFYQHYVEPVRTGE